MRKFLLICLIFFTINVNAKCETSELVRLRNIAEKVEFSYQHVLENNKSYFDITASNLHDDLKVLIIDDYYMDDYREFKYNSKGIYTLNKFLDDSKVVVTFKAFVPNECSGETVYSKTINLPFYNTYQNSDKCKEHPDFKYCQEFLEDGISQATFDNALNEYLHETPEGPNIEPNEKDKDVRLIILIVVVIFFVILGIYGICLVIKNKKANEL